ncbi:hypothetical protein TUM4261_27340 [Shewanella sp. c952]|uniref:hypothetical protein n=1 Tax=Shewanella sp. c952 TaxID=2815913 RepID=UPI001BC2D475|nr:hypothetical protein [Shewanella sp. c952]GIU13275.1 hypothetical protein TUM4261_27340 [Shewanella sp. c952]
MKHLAVLSLFILLSACGSNASYSVSASSDDDVMGSRQAPMMSDNTPIINDDLVKEADKKEQASKAKE